MATVMKILQILTVIVIGIIAGFAVLLTLPLLLLYVGVKIIGGMASKIR
ncbi:MAG: hypothetical protein K1V99_05340 [Bacteroidales bacterium]